MVRRRTVPLLLAASTLLMAVLVRVDAPIYRGVLFGDPTTVWVYDLGAYLRLLFPNSLSYLIPGWLGGYSTLSLLLTAALLPIAYGVGSLLDRMIARHGAWKALLIYLLGSVAFACAAIYVSWRYLWLSA